MSQPKHDRPDERDPEPPPPKSDDTRLGPPADPETTDAATGLKYVFRIAPADPKNSFDFEDVADK